MTQAPPKIAIPVTSSIHLSTPPASTQGFAIAIESNDSPPVSYESIQKPFIAGLAVSSAAAVSSATSASLGPKPTRYRFELSTTDLPEERADLLSLLLCGRCRKAIIAYKDNNMIIHPTCVCTHKQLSLHYNKRTPVFGAFADKGWRITAL